MQRIIDMAKDGKNLLVYKNSCSEHGTAIGGSEPLMCREVLPVRILRTCCLSSVIESCSAVLDCEMH